MESWEPVTSLCRTLLRELDEISDGVTDLIREAIPVYLVVPKAEHRRAVQQQLRIKLSALAAGRPLEDAELAAATELAAVRAAQGVPIDALISAYQTGDREIWRLLVDRGASVLLPLTPRLGGLLLAGTTVTTTVMARAHSKVARDIDGGRITLAHQLLGLVADPAELPGATLVANRLGFDPAGQFVGVMWLVEGSGLGAGFEPVSALLTDAPDVAARMLGQGRVEMLVQSGDPTRVEQLSSGRSVSERWGVGQSRAGLSGAAESLVDARYALAVADSGSPVVRFADRWREALVMAEGARVQTVLQPALQVARSHPHLAEVVCAFAASDMSIARTAKAVHLHANSVTYRLGRWGRLTGLNPRTFDGLADSLVAARLAAHDARESPNA